MLNNQIHKLMMITQTKDQYISPECEVLSVKSEGVICASVENPFDSNKELDW